MSRRFRLLLIAAWPGLLLPFLVSLLYARVWCKAASFKWHEGVLTWIADEKHPMIADPGGQGWSPSVGMASECERDRPELRAHEYTHVAQEVCCTIAGYVVGAVLAFAGHWKIALSFYAVGGWMIFTAVYLGGWVVAFAKHGTQPGAPWWYRAYVSIPWEAQAYAVEADYEQGKRPDAWGSKAMEV